MGLRINVREETTAAVFFGNVRTLQCGVGDMGEGRICGHGEPLATFGHLGHAQTNSSNGCLYSPLCCETYKRVVAFRRFLHHSHCPFQHDKPGNALETTRLVFPSVSQECYSVLDLATQGGYVGSMPM